MVLLEIRFRVTFLFEVNSSKTNDRTKFRWIFSFFVLFLRRLSCSSYLIALSISDNGYLLCLSLIWMDNLRLYLFHNNGICQMTVYLTMVFSSLSVWWVELFDSGWENKSVGFSSSSNDELLSLSNEKRKCLTNLSSSSISSSRFTVAFTTERFIVVAYPLKRSQYNSPSRARYVIIFLTIFAFIFYLSSLWASGIESVENPLMNRCVTRRGWLKFIRQMNLIDVFLTFIIPFVTIVTLNTLIIFKSGQYDRLLERNNVQSSGYVLHNLLEHRLRRFKYHRRITKMLLTISTAFLLLNTPMHLLKIYYFFVSYDETSDEKNHIESIIEMFTFNLFYTNFAINFFLYSLCGKNFRACLMDSVRNVGKTNVNHSVFSTAGGDNPFVQFNQRSQISRQMSRFSKRELSSTLSSGAFQTNQFVSTSNIIATLATGTSQNTLHPSISASSFRQSSFKIGLLNPNKTNCYLLNHLKSTRWICFSCTSFRRVTNKRNPLNSGQCPGNEHLSFFSLIFFFVVSFFIREKNKMNN